MVVNSGSIVRDSTLLLRQILASGITDPISGTRPTNSKFILTGYPDRPATYPIITIKSNYGNTERLGAFSESMKVGVDVEVRAWARNNKERDQLGDDVFRSLRNMQINSGSGTEVNYLYDYHIISSGDLDEDSKEGIHSKIVRLGYFTVV
jgi:hypothetical protein